MHSTCLELPQTALGSICSSGINYRVGAGQGVRGSHCPVLLPDLSLLLPCCRAKEIKTKLGTLLQKPDSTIDFIIPYPEKPEKPPKAQK